MLVVPVWLAGEGGEGWECWLHIMQHSVQGALFAVHHNNCVLFCKADFQTADTSVLHGGVLAGEVMSDYFR